MSSNDDGRIWSDKATHDFGAVRRSRVAPKQVDGGMHESYRLQHPAFGVCEVVQWHCSGETRLFGSDLGHHTGIRLTFKAAESIRSSLSSDRHHGGETLLQVDLSLSQWSRFVSSIGNGSVPVTIGVRRGGPLVPCPQIAAPEASKKELHGKEMAAALCKRLDAMERGVARLGALLESKSVSKVDLRGIHEELARHVSQLPGSVDFVFGQFAEATEQVADDAKTEVEAYVDGIAQRHGYESLRAMAPSLQRLKDGTAGPAVLDVIEGGPTDGGPAA